MNLFHTNSSNWRLDFAIEKQIEITRTRPKSCENISYMLLTLAHDNIIFDNEKFHRTRVVFKMHEI